MQIVGQVIKGTVVVVDIYGKEQTLGKGQTIVLGDTIKAKSEDAYVLFDTNPDPVHISASDAIEVDEDFLDYLAAQAKKAQEGVENTVMEDAQDEDVQDFIENDDEDQKNNTDTQLSNTSINSIDLFDTHIQTLELTHDFDEKQTTQESNLQFALVGDNGQYYLRGSDTEKLIVLAHARNGTLSDADGNRHFEVLGVKRDDIPVEEINTVLLKTHLPLQSTQDVPAVVQDVVNTLETWHKGGFLDTHDMQVLGLDHAGIDVANINEALNNTHFYATGTLATFYPTTQNIIQTLHTLADNHTIGNEQLHTLGVLDSSKALSTGELSYLSTLMDDLSPKSNAFTSTLLTDSTELLTTALSPTLLDLETSSDSGVSNDNRTNDTTPTLSIGLPADVSPGDIIKIYDGSQVLVTHTLTEDEATAHSLNMTLGTLAEGEHTLTATITDAHDNVSKAQALNAPSVLTIDTTAIISINTIAEDDVINAKEHEVPLIITGTSTEVEAGQTINITLNGQSYTSTIQADGTWSVTVPVADVQNLTDGSTYEVDANVSDVSANVATDIHNISVNTSAGISINDITGDNIINNAEHTNTKGVILQGATQGVEAGQTVHISIKDAKGKEVLTYHTVVKDVHGEAEEGSWSYTVPHSAVSGLVHGSAYTIEVRAQDASGNDATPATQEITIDTKADSDGNLAITLSDASDDNDVHNLHNTEAVDGDKQTNDKSPQMDLSGIDADVVKVSVTFTDAKNNTHTVKATQSNGTWTLPAENLPDFVDGKVTATVTVVDHVGNTTTTEESTFTLDTRADGDFDQAVNDNVTLAINLSQESVTGTASNQTNDKSPQMDLSGIDADVQTVTVTFTDSASHTLTVKATQSNDTWTLPPQELTGFQDGEVKATVTVVDDAGNVNDKANTTFTLDTSADGDANSGGDGIALAMTLNDASDTGVKGDNQTNDTTPTLDLKGIDTDAVKVIVHVGEETYTIHRNDAKSAWEGDDVANFSIGKNNTVTGLTSDAITEDREYPIDIQVIDDAGNTTAVIKGDAITLDTQVNVATITQDTTGKWHLTLDPDIVHIEIGTTVDTKTISVGTADFTGGKWVITPTAPHAYTIDGSIKDGFKVYSSSGFSVKSISTIVTDDAGNKSHASDSSLTAATVTLTDDTNSGSKDDNITNKKPHFTIDLAGQTDLLSIEVKYASNGHTMASAHRDSVNDNWTVDKHTPGDISINGTTATYTAPFSNNTDNGTYTYRVELQDANAQASETVKSTDFSVVYDTTDPTIPKLSMTFNEDTTGSSSFTNVPTDAHLGENPITIKDIPEGWHIVLVNGSVMEEGTKLSADELSNIQVTPPKDYYGTQYIRYTVTDVADNTSYGQIKVTVNNVNDAPIISDGKDAVGLTESNATLTATGTMTVTDVDKTDTITPSVTNVAVKGSTTIDNTTLKDMLTLTLPSPTNNIKDTLTWNFNSHNEAFDYLKAGETLELTYTVQVTDDGTGHKTSNTETVTITITGTNDAPVITSAASASVPENIDDTTTLYTITATDAENDNITYSIKDDTSNLFEIDAKSGAVTLIAGKNLDYETATSHTITVEASDGKGGSQTKDITIHVTNVDDNPVSAVTDIDNIDNKVSANAHTGTEVGIKASATDADGTKVTYSLTSNPDGLFTINEKTGVVTVAKDLSSKVGEHDITVQASSGNTTSTKDFTITVTDATPPEVKSITSEMNENGELVYTFTFTEAVKGFTEENITIEYASVEKNSLTGKDGDSVYTVIVTPNDDINGDVKVSIDKDAVHDLEGNGNTASDIYTQSVFMGSDSNSNESNPKDTSEYDYIFLKDGVDRLELTNYDHAKIDFGKGDDTLIINTNDTIALSNIHNVEHIETKANNVNITGTEHNDTLTLKGGMYNSGDIDLKGGNDTLIIDTTKTVYLSHIHVEHIETSINLNDFKINGTKENDTLTLKGGIHGGLSTGYIDLKDGNDDSLIIDTQKDVYLSHIYNVENISVTQVGTLHGTNSADTITLTSNKFTSINLRDADDTLTLKSGHDSSKNIDFGSGEDTLIINTTDKVDLSNINNVENIEVEKAGSISGSTGADTLTLNTSNFANINLGAGTDTLLISDDTTIDLSKVSNVENISVGKGTSLTGSGTHAELTLDDLGLTSTNDTIVLKDSNTEHDNGTIKIQSGSFGVDTPTSKDGYNIYTDDNNYTIKIEDTIDVTWQ